MFSLKPCDELVFATQTTTTRGFNQTPQDLIVGHSLSSDTNLISFSASPNQITQTTKSRLPSRRQTSSRNECNIRRIIEHRNLERKRREKMSNLYVSLQALLPMDPTKGKGSVCDQMEEAANYIKEMHKKIQELRTRRDKLKKQDNSSSWGTNNVESSVGSDSLHNSVAIHQVGDRLEILIMNKSYELELSPILSQLVEREIDVVSCVTTRTDAGFLHRIEILAKDMKSLDVSVLHHTLTGASKYL